ncbi:MAG TPA: hypothetical protein VGF56_15135 [Rhizomicrobium sp.]
MKFVIASVMALALMSAPVLAAGVGIGAHVGDVHVGVGAHGGHHYHHYRHCHWHNHHRVCWR